MSTQKTIESKAPKYVDDDSGSHYSNEFEEVLEVEKLIQQDFDFDARSKPTPFREARFLSSTVEVTGLWIEKVPHENKELVLKLQVPDDETRYLQLDWQKESQKIESIFKSFGISSDNAADIVGKKTHLNISTETNRARFSNVMRLSFDEMARVRHVYNRLV